MCEEHYKLYEYLIHALYRFPHCKNVYLKVSTKIEIKIKSINIIYQATSLTTFYILVYNYEPIYGTKTNLKLNTFHRSGLIFRKCEKTISFDIQLERL